jgi:3-methylcrotonyl-CoA carboxylase alpha subunit
VQVFADNHGHVVHLNERDCSLQRRHQKIIEEAPAPGMSAKLRAEIGKAAVHAAEAVGYRGAGTVEFIADGSKGLKSGGYWFMEMNTRLQVEHPVTEAVTGLDLVEWQFLVAAGEKLPLTQAKIPLQGHAVEARLYAENPARGFLPSTGALLALQFPDGVRVDSGVEEGSAITPFYDPMIAKLIAHAPTREAALEKLARALERTSVAGPHTNLALLAALCRAPQFLAGQFDTGFIERNPALIGDTAPDRAAAAFGAMRLVATELARIEQNLGGEPDAPASPWDSADGFQFSGTRSVAMPILLDGNAAEARIVHGAHGMTVTVDGEGAATDAIAVEAPDAVHVLRCGRQIVVRRADVVNDDPEHGGSDGQIRAPMHGKVVALLIKEGEHVERGQRLVIVEAMKMEHALIARRAGRVTNVAVSAGSQVAEGACLMSVETDVPES